MKLDDRQIEEAAASALAPFERGTSGENPFKIQQELQGTMQDLVGIVRMESEMQQSLQHLAEYQKRAQKTGVTGHREYHTGWHTSLDLRNLLIVSEAITLSAIDRKESRGGHFRQDFPDKAAAFSKLNIVTKKGPDGSMQVLHVPLPEMPAELKQVIEENK